MIRLRCYLYDLLILTNRSFKDYLLNLEFVFSQPIICSYERGCGDCSKSMFTAEQKEYLGYWIIRQAIQNIRNKIKMFAMLYILHPKQEKKTELPAYWYKQFLSQICGFVVMISSQLPLTSFTSSKVKFEWHSSHQQALIKFRQSLELICGVLICYPDFNRQTSFHLYTDASDY
jgi:hypothetical protein